MGKKEIPPMCGDQLDNRFSSRKVSSQVPQVRAGFYKAASPPQIAAGRKSRLWSARPATAFVSWSLGLMLRQVRVQGDVLPGLLGRTLQSIQMKRFRGRVQSLFVGTSDVPLSRSLEPHPSGFYGG